MGQEREGRFSEQARADHALATLLAEFTDDDGQLNGNGMFELLSACRPMMDQPDDIWETEREKILAQTTYPTPSEIVFDRYILNTMRDAYILNTDILDPMVDAYDRSQRIVTRRTKPSLNPPIV